jgi:hypothetical protein
MQLRYNPQVMKEMTVYHINAKISRLFIYTALIMRVNIVMRYQQDPA